LLVGSDDLEAMDYVIVSIEIQWVLHHGRVGTHGKAVVDILGAVFCNISIFEDYFFMKLVLKKKGVGNK
jgi:hypothetical protein